MMQMVEAFAEFERAMIKERTKVGLDAPREEGRIGGRRPKLLNLCGTQRFLAQSNGGCLRLPCAHLIRGAA